MKAWQGVPGTWGRGGGNEFEGKAKAIDWWGWVGLTGCLEKEAMSFGTPWRGGDEGEGRVGEEKKREF